MLSGVSILSTDVPFERLPLDPQSGMVGGDVTDESVAWTAETGAEENVFLETGMDRVPDGAGGVTYWRNSDGAPSPDGMEVGILDGLHFASQDGIASVTWETHGTVVVSRSDAGDYSRVDYALCRDDGFSPNDWGVVFIEASGLAKLVPAESDADAVTAWRMPDLAAEGFAITDNGEFAGTFDRNVSRPVIETVLDFVESDPSGPRVSPDIVVDPSGVGRPVSHDLWNASRTGDAIVVDEPYLRTGVSSVSISTESAAWRADGIRNAENSESTPDRLLILTAWDSIASLVSRVDPVVRTMVSSQADLAKDLTWGGSPAISLAAHGAALSDWGVPSDGYSLLPANTSLENDFVSEYAAEGGLVDIGSELGSPFPATWRQDDASAEELPWNRRAGRSGDPDSWNGGVDDHATLAYGPGETEEYDVEGPLFVGERGGLTSRGGDEGGMIAFAVESCAEGWDTFAQSTAPQAAAALSSRNVEIECGIGFYQDFDLAGASFPSESNGDLVLRGDEGDARLVKASRRVVTDQSPGTVMDAVGRHVGDATKMSTVVLASMAVVVSGRRRKDASEEWNSRESRRRSR
jgi:hypothetical protein